MFNGLWDEFYPLLPALPTLVHNFEDGKAAVFNTWLRYSNIRPNAVIKPEKLLTHSFVEDVSNKMRASVPDELLEDIKQRLEDPFFTFVYSYLMCQNLLKHLEGFLNKAENVELKKFIKQNYYFITVDDTDDQDPMFQGFKQLHVKYLNGALTKKIIFDMYLSSKNEAMVIVKTFNESRQP